MQKGVRLVVHDDDGEENGGCDCSFPLTFDVHDTIEWFLLSLAYYLFSICTCDLTAFLFDASRRDVGVVMVQGCLVLRECLL